MATIPVVGLPLQFKKMFAGPITSDQIFESMEAAEAFAASPSFYPGAPISVKTTDENGNETWTLYVTQADRSLKQAGETAASIDEIQEQVKDLQSEMFIMQTDLKEIKEVTAEAVITAASVERKVEELQTIVENNNTTSQEQTQQITNLTTTVQEQAEQINNLNTTVNENGEKINNLETTVQGNTKTVSELKTKTELNEEAIVKLTATHADDVGEMQKDVEEVQDSVELNTEAIKELQAAMVWQEIG